MYTNLPNGGWKASGIGARFGGAEGLRKYCRVETVVAPRTNVGAGGNYYHNSPKSLIRMNRMMTGMALARPRRTARPGDDAGRTGGTSRLRGRAGRKGQ